ncbi:MAG: helix-turn-helix transcriptional regulator [Eubacteriales bacterium]|nr:helix-turn-helix transcriptional regulator [Eubacteriales bacterium]
MSTPRPRTNNGEKNLISKRLITLRKQHNLSQRELAHQMQLAGYDIDKNVITRIENNQRYVTDIEIRGFAKLFDVSYEYLMDGED